MVETRGGRRFAIFFFLAAFLILLLGRWLEPVDRVALSLAAPFDSAITAVATGIGDAMSGVFDGPRLRDENASLQKEIGVLLHRNAQLQQAAHENLQLRQMVRFETHNPRMQLLASRVIGTDPNDLSPDILINKGTRDGLRPGMTVLDANGYFLGSISDLTGNAAKVLLVVSPSSTVGALDLRSQAKGVVDGKYAGNPEFRFVETSAALRVGDFVVTSGELNLYPRNLVIGQITNVSHSNSAVLQQAEVRPLANLGDLEMVQVVRNWVPSVPAALLEKP